MADIESNIGINIDASGALAALKNLQRQISAFHTSLANGNAKIQADSASLRKDLVNNINATGKFAATFTKIKTTTESFTDALEKNKLSMGQYFRYSAAATKKFGKSFTAEFATIDKVARERVKDLQTQYIKLGRDASGAMQAIKVRPLVLDMKSLTTQTQITAQKQQIFNQLLKQGSTNLLNFGKNTQWAGRQLMVGFTIPLSIFGNMAAKTFMDLEKQVIRFRRVYGDAFSTQEETNKAVRDVQRLAAEFTKYGIEIEKTLELAADAAQMGLTGAALSAQITNATRLSVLGEVEQQEALRTTISITNAFGIAAEDLASKIDFLNAVENESVTAINDLTIAIPKAAPVVMQLGGGIEDLAFFLTAMKEGGINASEGANALKSGLASLINPTDKASQMLARMGINIGKIVEANKGDVKGIVIEFAKALDELDPLSRAQAIEQLFGKFQFARISTLFQNVIAEGTQAQKVLELANATTQELAAISERELGNVADSTTFKFQKAVEDLKFAIAPIGEQFLKAITPVIEFATDLLEKFNSLGDGVKNFVVIGGTILAGLGPVFLMLFGLVANGVANIIKGFAAVRGLFLKTKDSTTILGDQFDYMTREQLEAASVAASLEQAHMQLQQRFTSEAASVEALRKAYDRAIAAQQRFRGSPGQSTPDGLKLASGIVSVPGPKGAGDVVPAMLSPGEAVIPAAAAKKYAPLIEGMVSGNIPGFNKGVVSLGMPRSGKSTLKNREAAELIYQEFLKSSYSGVPPTNYGHQLAPTTGHSFPIFGLGGVYMGPGGKKVFVKPVMDEKAAHAEIRGTRIAREAHGLEAPDQRIVVIRDPQDVTGKRRFLALESALDSKFVNTEPKALFNEEQYFRQLVASLVRVDKDLSAGNVFGNVVADVGPAGVFNRASGVRDYTTELPSMEDQAMVNLLGIRGGAKRAFAESTVQLMAKMTADQYHQYMITEIQRVLPALRQTVASFGLTNPAEADAYAAMIKRLEAGLGVNWRKFHEIHSAVKVTAPKQTKNPMPVPGYANGVVSVPGPKGAGDVVPAMLSPGEAVIPAEMAKKYAPLVNSMIADNIPGYAFGLGAVAGQYRQPGGKSTPKTVNASHVSGMESTNLAATMLAIAEVDEEFGQTEVVVTELVPVLDEFGNQVTRTIEVVDEATGKAKTIVQELFDDVKTIKKVKDLDPNKEMMVQGLGFGGTAIPERQLRNKDAYQAAGVGAAPFTLEEVVTAGDKAAEALSRRRNELTEDVIRELELMVQQGQEARSLRESENSATADLTYSKQTAATAIEFALNQDAGNGLSASDAKAEAERRTAAVLEQYELDLREGMAAEDALDNARLRLQKAMIESSQREGSEGIQFTSSEATGSSRDLLRPYNTKGPKAIKSKSTRQLVNRDQNTVSRGRDAAAAAARMGSVGADSLDAIYANMTSVMAPSTEALSLATEAGRTGAFAIHRTLIGEIEEGLGINSPSREYEQISNSITAGVRQADDDARVAGEKLGQNVASGASFVKPTASAQPSYTPTKIPASVPVPSGTQANNIAQKAGVESMGPIRAYFTMVSANLRDVAQEFRNEIGLTARDTMGPLEAYFTTVRANMRESLQESRQEFAAIFNGSSAAVAQNAQEIKVANNKVVIAGKEYSRNLIADAQGRNGAIEAVLTKKNAELLSKLNAQYQDGTLRIIDSLNAQDSQFSLVGGSIVNELTKGMIKQAAANAPAVAAASGTTISPSLFAQQGNFLGPVDAGPAFDINTKKQVMTFGEKLSDLNAKTMAFSGTISSLGMMAAFAGDGMGDFGQQIYQLSNAFFILTGILQLVNSLELARIKNMKISSVTDFFASMKTSGIDAFTKLKATAKVGEKVFSGGLKNSVLNVGKLFGTLGNKVLGLAGGFGRFIPIIGAAIAAFQVITFISNVQKEQEAKIRGMGDAAFAAGEKLKIIGGLIPEYEPSRDPGTYGAGVVDTATGQTATSRAIELSIDKDQLSEQLAAGGELYDLGVAIKSATKDGLETVLTSLANQLIALDPTVDPNEVKGALTAIAKQVGRTDISFGQLLIPNPDDPKFKSNLKSALDAISADTLALQEKYAKMSTPPPGMYGTAPGLAETQRAEVTAQTALGGDTAAIVGRTLSAYETLNTALRTGALEAEEFRAQSKLLLDSLSLIDPNLLMPELDQRMLDLGFDPGMVVNELETVEAKILAIRSAALVPEGSSGIDIALLKAVDAGNKLGATSEDIRNARIALEQIEQQYDANSNAAINSSNEIVTEGKKAASVWADQIAANEQLLADAAALVEANKELGDGALTQAAAIAMLKDETFALQYANATDAKAREQLIKDYKAQEAAAQSVTDVLEKQAALDAAQELLEQSRKNVDIQKELELAGFDAAEAQKILANSTWSLAFAAASSAEEIADLKAKYEEWVKLAGSQPATGGGGTKEKSPYEQAIEQLKEQGKEILNNRTAFSRLREEGFSVSASFAAAKDSVLAAALASTKVGTSKWKELIRLVKDFDKKRRNMDIAELTRQNNIEIARINNIALVREGLEEAGYSAEVIEKAIEQIGDNPDILAKLASDLKDGRVNAKNMVDLLKSIDGITIAININKTPQELRNEALDAIGVLNDYFSTQTSLIQNAFATGTEISLDIDNDPKTQDVKINVDKVNTTELEKTIAKAQEDISAFNANIDDYQYALDQIQKQEDEINKTYDERLKALDKLADLNSEISEAQRSQLDISTALASGDIAAAARAMQEEESRRAAAAKEAQKKQLENERERKLSQITADINGEKFTRIQLEEKILDLQTKIAKIEEETLEPAQRALENANYQIEALISTISYAGKNQAAWKLIEDQIRLANIELAKYLDMLKQIAEGKFNFNGGSTFTGPTNTVAAPTPKSLQGSTTYGNLELRAQDPKAFAEARAAEERALLARDDIGPKAREWAEKRLGQYEQTAANLMIGGLVSYKRMGGKIPYRAMGGSIPRFANGGGMRTMRYAGPFNKFKSINTDTVPAMLTPGEFVVRKFAVQKYGVDKLKSINNGTYESGSVYNYSVNVNVSTDADPDQIANAVMTQIRRTESQRIRRF